MIRTKVCGITRLDDALLAVDLGAAAIGMVFWPHSPRAIDETRAREIASALPRHVTAVGVFVDQPVEEVRRIAEAAALSAIQLHGDESIEYIAALMHPVMKAVPVTDRFVPSVLDRYPDAVTVLLDAHDPIRRGGTGRRIDWSLAAAAASRRRVFLSGGLDAGNIGEAVAVVRPYGVDLSSGVESAPGIKDPAKLRAFFTALASLPDAPGESANHG